MKSRRVSLLLVTAAWLVLGWSSVATSASSEVEEALHHLGNSDAGGDLREASKLLKVALADEPPGDERDRLVLILAVCQHFLGQTDKDVIALVEELAARNPGFAIRLPEQKIAKASAIPMLGYLYEDKGDWQRALDTFEQYLRINPKATAIIVHAARMREKLRLIENKQGSEPVVFVCNRPLSGEVLNVEGTILAYAAALANSLELQVAQEPGSAELTVARARAADSPSPLVLTLGSKTAVGDGEPISLAVAPKQSGEHVLVPVAAVSKYFGARVIWDTHAKILWVN